MTTATAPEPIETASDICPACKRPTLDPLNRLAKDVKAAASTLSTPEARILVDLYYTMQEHRIAADGQTRSLAKGGEPHMTLAWFGSQMDTLEAQVRTVLDAYSNSQELGIWARSIVGIGPVIAAGLLAHIDLTKAPTVGHIWRFAGLDPTVKWAKGKKRPWNATLKTLCWKIGESFVKVQNNENDVYGKLYAKRKAEEIAKNDAGLFAAQAAESLKAKDWTRDTTTKAHYLEGKLPPARLHLRAERYAVKIFLAHYHEVGRKLLGLDVPLPYPIAHMGHAHKIEPPNT